MAKLNAAKMAQTNMIDSSNNSLNQNAVDSSAFILRLPRLSSTLWRFYQKTLSCTIDFSDYKIENPMNVMHVTKSSMTNSSVCNTMRAPSCSKILYKLLEISWLYLLLYLYFSKYYGWLF